MTTAVASPPERGQLVSVRSRQWVLNDVRPSTLPASALKPAFNGPQHLLTLSSVEDDGLGEELQVVWEIEPGTKVIEKARAHTDRLVRLGVLEEQRPYPARCSGWRTNRARRPGSIRRGQRRPGKYSGYSRPRREEIVP